MIKAQGSIVQIDGKESELKKELVYLGVSLRRALPPELVNYITTILTAPEGVLLAAMEKTGISSIGIDEEALEAARRRGEL